MAWASKQKVGSPIGKLLLISLANYADERGQCWPSAKRLAEDCETTERTVFTWLKKLEEMNLISHQTRSEDGMKTSNLYTLSPGNPDMKQLHNDMKELHNDMKQLQGGYEGVSYKPINEPINNKNNTPCSPPKNKSRKEPISEDWWPDKDMQVWATTECPNVDWEHETKIMINWALENDHKRVWNLTWKNWILRKQKETPNVRAYRGQTKPARKNTYQSGETDWGEVEAGISALNQHGLFNSRRS